MVKSYALDMTGIGALGGDKSAVYIRMGERNVTFELTLYQYQGKNVRLLIRNIKNLARLLHLITFVFLYISKHIKAFPLRL